MNKNRSEIRGALRAKNKAKATPAQERGVGSVKRSKSGGAVKGKIPNAGGSNATNFETGITTVTNQKLLMHNRPKAKKGYQGKSIANKGMGNGKGNK